MGEEAVGICSESMSADGAMRKCQFLDRALSMAQWLSGHLAVVLIMLGIASSAHAARLALVIGNDQYQAAPTLKNARNDARLIAGTLKDAGYEVVGGVRENLGEKAMWRAIDQFAQRVQNGDEVAFFFAGHGVQLRDTVLLPVDIQPDNADQVERDGVPLGALQDKLSRAKFALLIIDACRDNPFPPRPGTRSLGETRGLAPPASVARGSAVLLAAGRGQKALDFVPGGTTGNGLFTHELNALLRTPGLGVIAAARTVRDRVEEKARAARHEQRPTLVDDVSGDYVLFASPNSQGEGQATPMAAVTPELSRQPQRPSESLQSGLISGRYQVLGDGAEVKDLQTGLVWQRCSVGQRWVGTGCEGVPLTLSFDAAQRAESNGWRLPTARELATLVHCSTASTRKLDDLSDGRDPVANWCAGDFAQPTISLKAFPNTPSKLYWSSSPKAGMDNYSMRVDFDDGGLTFGPHQGFVSVRLVRAER